MTTQSGNDAEAMAPDLVEAVERASFAVLKAHGLAHLASGKLVGDLTDAAIAALNVTALIQAEREACAKSLDVKTTSANLKLKRRWTVSLRAENWQWRSISSAGKFWLKKPPPSARGSHD